MKKCKLKKWAKEHKTELFFTGGIIATTICIVLLSRKNGNTNRFMAHEPTFNSAFQPAITNERASVLLDETKPIKIIDIKEHLRNLPAGHRASDAKIAEAAASGIQLLENQTLVSTHPRCYAA